MMGSGHKRAGQMDVYVSMTMEILHNGHLRILKEAQKHGVTIFPIDSEHSAIFQSMEGHLATSS